jgi:hypothetical protein
VSEEKGAAAGDRTAAADPCARLLADLADVLRCMGMSDEARHHFTSARIEMLKGLRALIDSRIEKLSAEPSKGTSVPID